MERIKNAKNRGERAVVKGINEKEEESTSRGKVISNNDD